MNSNEQEMPAEERPARIVCSIHILRGVAALLVMGFHHSHYLKSVIPGIDLGFQLFGSGYVGVDIFFIVSGFVMVHSTERPEHSKPVDFAIRRFFRVVPLAQIATVGCFWLMSVKPSRTTLVRSLLFLPRADINPPSFGGPVVVQEWTLSYELIFYGIFALVLIFTHRHRVVAAALALATGVMVFQYPLGGPISFRPDAVYVPQGYQGAVPPEIWGVLGNPIMLEFILGMLLAAAYRQWEGWLRSESKRWAERVAALLLIGLFIYLYFSEALSGNGVTGKGVGAASLVTGALLLETSSRSRLESARIGVGLFLAVGLGNISYSLYLVHVEIAERLLRYPFKVLFGTRIDGLAGFIGMAATSLVLAVIAHILIERPFVAAGKWLIASKNRRFAGSAPAPV
jgi:peptidoglycan/LPS O-acetylase OafA/YrhL